MEDIAATVQGLVDEDRGKERIYQLVKAGVEGSFAILAAQGGEDETHGLPLAVNQRNIKHLLQKVCEVGTGELWDALTDAGKPVFSADVVDLENLYQLCTPLDQIPHRIGVYLLINEEVTLSGDVVYSRYGGVAVSEGDQWTGPLERRIAKCHFNELYRSRTNCRMYDNFEGTRAIIIAVNPERNCKTASIMQVLEQALILNLDTCNRQLFTQFVDLQKVQLPLLLNAGSRFNLTLGLEKFFAKNLTMSDDAESLLSPLGIECELFLSKEKSTNGTAAAVISSLRIRIEIRSSTVEVDWNSFWGVLVATGSVRVRLIEDGFQFSIGRNGGIGSWVDLSGYDILYEDFLHMRPGVLVARLKSLDKPRRALQQQLLRDRNKAALALSEELIARGEEVPHEISLYAQSRTAYTNTSRSYNASVRGRDKANKLLEQQGSIEIQYSTLDANGQLKETDRYPVTKPRAELNHRAVPMNDPEMLKKRQQRKEAAARCLARAAARKEVAEGKTQTIIPPPLPRQPIKDRLLQLQKVVNNKMTSKAKRLDREWEDLHPGTQRPIDPLSSSLIRYEIDLLSPEQKLEREQWVAERVAAAKQLGVEWEAIHPNTKRPIDPKDPDLVPYQERALGRDQKISRYEWKLEALASEAWFAYS